MPQRVLRQTAIFPGRDGTRSGSDGIVDSGIRPGRTEFGEKGYKRILAFYITILYVYIYIHKYIIYMYIYIYILYIYIYIYTLMDPHGLPAYTKSDRSHAIKFFLHTPNIFCWVWWQRIPLLSLLLFVVDCVLFHVLIVYRASSSGDVISSLSHENETEGTQQHNKTTTWNRVWSAWKILVGIVAVLSTHMFDIMWNSMQSHEKHARHNRSNSLCPAPCWPAQLCVT